MALARQSAEFDMTGKLHLDLIFRNKFLLNGIEARICLICSKDMFCLHENANQSTDKVLLKEITLFCRKVKPNPAVQLAHVKALQHDTAKYPVKRVNRKTFTVQQATCRLQKKNLFLVQLPTRIVTGIIDKNLYNEVITKSPFCFKHNGVNFMCL